MGSVREGGGIDKRQGGEMEKDEKEFVQEIKKQFELLKTERAKREGDWKEVQQYVAPSVFNWDNPADKTPKRPKRFTSRPTNYLKTLRSGIIGYSISPNIAWQKIGLENYDVANSYGVKDWLEGVEKTLYAEFNRSNLYPQASKFVENAAVYGFAVMLIDEQIADGKVRYLNLNVNEVYLDTDEYDAVDTVFRRYVMTLKNAASFFGEENLDGIRREDLKDKNKWNNEITVIHAVYKRREFDSENKSSKNMPYASIYIDEERDWLMEESGYRDFPFSVFIWDQANGTAYGESPAIQALDDIKLLNIADESRIRIAQYAAEPALNVPESLKENVNVVPRGYNYYSKPNEVITPINTGQNYPINLDIQREMENRVKDWFHVDFFLALMNERPANITATYVMELQGEKAAVLSDLVVNLNAALTKIIQRSFNILWRQGKLPTPPEALAGSGAQLKVDFVGPLAQAQKKFHESAGIGQGIGLIGAVARMSPEALDVIDFDQTLKAGLEGMGFPQIAIREDRDIEELRKQRAQQQQAQQQQVLAMEQQKQLMGNYDKLNEPVKQGSAIDEMDKQTRGGFYQ
jgi:hypothetical protein